MFEQARSITYDHTLVFREPIHWAGGMNTTSRYGIGLSLLYIPGLLLFSWLQPFAPSLTGPNLGMTVLYEYPLYTAAGAPVHVVITALTAFLVARTCRLLCVGTRIAVWATLAFGLGSPAFVYAKGDFAQTLTGLCWIAAVYGAIRFRATPRPKHGAICAVAVGFAVITRPVEGAMLVPAAALLMAPDLVPSRWSRGTWIGMLQLGSATLGGVIATLLVNWARYGDPVTTGYEGVSWTTPITTGLAGALVSPGRSILLSFPAALLAPLGAVRLWRRGRRTVGLAIAGLVTLELLNVAAWQFWWGGWNWGLRLFVPALPLVTVLAACGLHAIRGRRRWWAAVGSLAAGLVWVVPCVLADLLGGYGGIYSGTSASFAWRAYPPVGVWDSIARWRGASLSDGQSIDILWFRLARSTGNSSLAVPFVCVIGAAALVSYAFARHRASSWAGSTSQRAAA